MRDISFDEKHARYPVTAYIQCRPLLGSHDLYKAYIGN
jgi:hypothetical protein